MTRFVRLVCALAAVLLCTAAPLVAQEAPEAYPVRLAADDVYKIPKLSVEMNGLKLTGTDLLAVPIRCEPGITGAMLLGSGRYQFLPADGEAIQGEFRAAMVRFNPEDAAKLLPIETDSAMTDRAAYEMARHLLSNVFGHCWHSGNNALIPSAGSFVADVYSTTLGDVLISTGPDGTVVHSFSDRKTLYTQK